MFVSCVVDFCWPSWCVVVWSEGRKFFVVAMTTAEARLSQIEMIRAALITKYTHNIYKYFYLLQGNCTNAILEILFSFQL